MYVRLWHNNKLVPNLVYSLLLWNNRCPTVHCVYLLYISCDVEFTFHKHVDVS